LAGDLSLKKELMMLRKCPKLLVLVLAGLAVPVSYAANFYAVAGAQQSRSVKLLDVSDAGHHVGAGYVINQDWSVELSAESLFSDAEIKGITSLDSEALTLAILGKTKLDASSVFFYRAGVSQIKHQASFFAQPREVVAADGKTVQVRDLTIVDDKLVHGVFGFGLEQNFSDRWLGRVEIIRTFKNDEIGADSLRLSLGYRF
jgi:hypothetical protein